MPTREGVTGGSRVNVPSISSLTESLLSAYSSLFYPPYCRVVNACCFLLMRRSLEERVPRLEREKAHAEGELMKVINALSERETALSEVELVSTFVLHLYLFIELFYVSTCVYLFCLLCLNLVFVEVCSMNLRGA